MEAESEVMDNLSYVKLERNSKGYNYKIKVTENFEADKLDLVLAEVKSRAKELEEYINGLI